MNIINEFYDTDFFDRTVLNISLLKFSKSKNEAIDFVKINKDGFSSSDKYNDTYNFLNSLDENENIQSYIKEIK